MVKEVAEGVIFCDDFIPDEMDFVLRDAIRDLKFDLGYDCVPADGLINISHPIIDRPESCESRSVKHEPKSDMIGFARSMLDLFLVKTDMPHKYEILRSAINLTFKQSKDSRVGLYHFDHDYSHKQFIMMINDHSVGGGTMVKVNNESIFLPSVYKGAYMFDCLEHAAVDPEYGARIMLIVTLRFVDDE